MLINSRVRDRADPGRTQTVKADASPNATDGRPGRGPGENGRVSSLPVVAVVGATASGKTALSLDLAQALGGEIVNTDAMQLYRGMDIGTAKLPEPRRRRIRHHLLDVLDVTEPATVAEFQAMARAAIDDIHARGRVPVLVGGSALYTRAVLDRFEFPGTDDSVRRELEAELDRLGPGELHRRLAGVDPEAAERIEPGNGRRIVRALEVIALTGRPFSASLPRLEYHYPRACQIGVRIDRPTLDDRIGQRVEEMFADGLVDEVDRLLRQGLAQGRTAGLAIGYREVAAHLAGDLTLAEAKERTAQATRRFARRQESWFTKDPRIHWVDWDDPQRTAKAVAVVTRQT
ncbi:tRNA (adenosine(37)-N6)-dimethylallyltransferase MiaA [Nocardioides gansuensis]|uniref:tRNA dimethylallyltransferase n=1 Tax=Nocardioides gansuensis TaxID=2138300 RepID=A0A2T8F5H5_9ACTN|nr:tRNA (adenosine(37)-N6)-dimethylallyltransferase MiaA [Nocardioides gansuensis]